jgi:hypothetical protein
MGKKYPRSTVVWDLGLEEETAAHPNSAGEKEVMSMDATQGYAVCRKALAETAEPLFSSASHENCMRISACS